MSNTRRVVSKGQEMGHKVSILALQQVEGVLVLVDINKD